MTEIKDATLELTLDEIKARDIDNLTLVWTASKEHIFPYVDHAIAFMGQATNKALVKLGVTALDRYAKSFHPQKHNARLLEKQLDRQMKEKDVRVEHRVYGKKTVTMLQQAEFYERRGMDEHADFLRKMAVKVDDKLADAWRSGQYFYHGNEIAFFIADPIIRDASRRTIILPGQTEVVVVTNVPM